VVIIPDDSVGVVTKKFVLVGKNRRLPDGKIVAFNGEAGFQADTLSPGLHMGLWPWQFLVPDVVAGSGDGRSGTLVDVLLAGLVRESMKKAV
jgi:hypothetical protein